MYSLCCLKIWEQIWGITSSYLPVSRERTTLAHWHLPQVPGVQPVGRCSAAGLSFFPCVLSLAPERCNVINVFFICNLLNMYYILHWFVWARNVYTEYRTGGKKTVCEGEGCFWVSIQPFMFGNTTSLLPVINSETVASAAVSVWRDGRKRKCLLTGFSFIGILRSPTSDVWQGSWKWGLDHRGGSSPRDRMVCRGWKCGL